MVDNIIKEAVSFAEPERAKLVKKYFNCIPGGYGEGDTFAGIKNPILRKIAKQNVMLSSSDLTDLLQNEIHEIRMLALYIFQFKFSRKKTSEQEKEVLVAIYLNHTKYINNWDLVDISAHYVLGAFYFNKETDIFIKLAKSSSLWENRIAMIATFYHIQKNSFDIPLHIAELLLAHKHDLIHKAVGWMLREIGKRNLATELSFLKKHYNEMPRTMLRYAIEKFDEPLRQQILKGTY